MARNASHEMPRSAQTYPTKYGKSSDAVLDTLTPTVDHQPDHFWTQMCPQKQPRVPVRFCPFWRPSLPRNGPVWDHHLPKFAVQCSTLFAEILYCVSAKHCTAFCAQRSTKSTHFSLHRNTLLSLIECAKSITKQYSFRTRSRLKTHAQYPAVFMRKHHFSPSSWIIYLLNHT